MKSLFPYVGGKSKLASRIAGKFPTHKTYCEAYAGAGWVFFGKEPSPVEIINDLDGELVSFYRVVQNHPEEFCRQFKYLLTSREVFHDFMTQRKAGGLTDIQKAARYFYNQKLCFGGKPIGQSFGTARERPARLNLVRLEEDITAAYFRLARVVIENLPALEIIRRYDSEATLFYLDPPYYLAPCYRHNMALFDYQVLADRLGMIKGKFVLSINDHAEMREVFKGFEIEPVGLKYTIGLARDKEAKELLITNFK